ncbi:mCG147956 [Mus musculus]|nr:mCG147956 [Mus musculus]
MNIDKKGSASARERKYHLTTTTTTTTKILAWRWCSWRSLLL